MVKLLVRLSFIHPSVRHL